MKMKGYIKSILLCTAVLFAGCTNLDEIYYSEIAQNTFFSTKDNIYAALARPYTKWRGTHEFSPWMLQECVADEFCVSQKGADYADERYRQLQWHTWTPDNSAIYDTYFQIGEGISYALAMISELSDLDYPSFGLSETEQTDHILQLKMLVAYSYMRGLDYFGGMPIYREYTLDEVQRSTARETFDFIESWFKEGIADNSTLKKKTLGAREEGWVNQGIVAACLARLYFNAQVYIGEPRFDECARLCQDIIDGKYGEYELEDTWSGPFGFDNDYSTEVIWSCASQYSMNQISWDFERFNHYNAKSYYDIDGMGATNGAHLQPSLAPDDTPYKFNVGTPFARFHEKDLRKKPYLYLGNKEYEGMFLYGKQEREASGGRKLQCLGEREYKGEVITFVDKVAPFRKVGTEYSSVAELPSTIINAEENSGVRLVKRPVPDNTGLDLRYNPDYVIIRLSEIYYMLAECKYRAGDKDGAADLFNEVRKRNFDGQADPDKCSAANLDKYRILEEWMTEFLGEGRRRTDLRRWNAFTTEEWWDHQPSEHYRELFPIPQKSISASNVNLKQNPGYGGDEMPAAEAGLYNVPDSE